MTNKPVRQSSDRRGCSCILRWMRRGMWGPGTGMRGPFTSPGKLCLPRDAPSSEPAEIRKALDETGKTGATEAGKRAVMAPIAFLSCANGHKPPKLCPEKSSGVLATKTPCYHRRCLNPGGETGTRTPRMAIFKAGGLERNGFVPMEILPKSLFFFSSIVATSFIPKGKLFKPLQFSPSSLLAAFAPLKVPLNSTRKQKLL